MLNVMRENLRHLKWVLWAVAIAMVLSLGLFFDCGGPARRTAAGPWAAEVNGVVLTESDFIRVARNFDGYYRQLFGDNYSQIKAQLQVGNQAMQALVEQEMILQDAERLGLRASDKEVATMIRSDPGLKDETGEFIGADRYVQLLSRRPGGVAAYERELASQIVLDKWTGLVTQSASVSEEELERTHRQRTEKTALSYVIVAAADQDVDTSIDEEAVRLWYETHPEDYQRPEGRRIRWIILDRDSRLDDIEITDEALAEYYDANQANYSHPERRSARHILFRVAPGASDEERQAIRDQAQDVLDRVKSGEDFATLARAMSQDPGSAQNGGDLGFFSRGDMVAGFEAATFGTPVGEFADIAETEIGFHVIQVTGAEDAGTTPLDDVREEIRLTLRTRAAQEQVVADAQRLRDQLQSAADLDAVAAGEGLQVDGRFVTAGERLVDIGASPEFVQAVFDLQPGGVSAPLRVASGMALAVVDELVPESLAPLEDVENEVRTDLLNDRARRVAIDRARRALERSSDLASAAARLSTEPVESGDLGPGQTLPGIGGSTPEFEERLFGADAAVGDRGVIEVPAGALLYEITSREPFDRLSFEMAKPELRVELLRQRRDMMRQSILDQMRSGQEIVVNDELVRRFNG